MGKLKDSLQNHTGIQIGKSAFSEAVAEWASSRAKRATTPAEAAFWSAPLIGKLLVLADAAKDAEQSVRDAYFAFWEQRFEVLFDYTDRLQKDFSINTIRDRVYAATGTVCTPAAFAPPASVPATLITGPAVTLSVVGGGCTLSTVSLPLYGELAVNCDNPGASVKYAQPRYVNEYIGGASFRTEECKAQQKFGLEATVMIDLGKPFDGSSLTGNLGDTVFGRGGAFADSNTQGIPNIANPQFLKRFYDAFNSRLLQADVTVQQRQTPVEMVRAQVVDSLQALGLDQFAEIVEVKATTTTDPGVAAVGGSEFARLFPNIFDSERKAGALKDIFAGVLKNGLASTLYKERNADGTLIEPTRGAGVGAENTGGSNSSNSSSSSSSSSGSASGGSSGGSSNRAGSNTAPPTTNIFQDLAAEMERLLALRDFIHEAPPTGHRVVKKNGTTIYSSDTDPLISLAATGAATNTTGKKTAIRLGGKGLTFTNAGAAAVTSQHQATADTTAAAEASAAAVDFVVAKLAASAALLGLKDLLVPNSSVDNNFGNTIATAAAAAAAVLATRYVPLVSSQSGSVGIGANQTGNGTHGGAQKFNQSMEGSHTLLGASDMQKVAGKFSSTPASLVTSATVLMPIVSSDLIRTAGTAQVHDVVTGGSHSVSNNLTGAEIVSLLGTVSAAAGNMQLLAQHNDTSMLKNLTQLTQELKDAYAAGPVKPKAP